MYLKDRTFISSLSLSRMIFFFPLSSPPNGRGKEEEGVVTVYVSLFLFFVFSLFFFLSFFFVRLFLDCITAKEKMYAQIYFDGRGSPLYAARLPRWIWIFVQHRCARVFPPSGAHILPEFAPSGAHFCPVSGLLLTFFLRTIVPSYISLYDSNYNKIERSILAMHEYVRYNNL